MCLGKPPTGGSSQTPLTLSYPAKVDALHSTGESTPLNYLYRIDKQYPYLLLSAVVYYSHAPCRGFNSILADCRQQYSNPFTNIPFPRRETGGINISPGLPLRTEGKPVFLSDTDPFSSQNTKCLPVFPRWYEGKPRPLVIPNCVPLITYSKLHTIPFT